MQTQLQFIWASSRRSHSRSVQPRGFAFPPQFYWDIVDIQQGLHSDFCPCAANFCHWGVLCTWMSKQNPVLTGTWPHAQPLNRLLFLSATHWNCLQNVLHALLPYQRDFTDQNLLFSPVSQGHHHEHVVLSGTWWFLRGLLRWVHSLPHRLSSGEGAASLPGGSPPLVPWAPCAL